jgi:hypothetical protein
VIVGVSGNAVEFYTKFRRLEVYGSEEVAMLNALVTVLKEATIDTSVSRPTRRGAVNLFKSPITLFYAFTK